MTADYSIKTPLVKTSFGVQGGVRKFDKETGFQGSAGVSMRAEKNGTHVELGVGTGGVTYGNLEIGHELRKGKWGLDLSAKGQMQKSNKEHSVTIESYLDVYRPYIDPNAMCNDHQVVSTEIKTGYKPSSLMFGGAAKATYRPNDRVKLTAGVEAGAIIPTSEFNVELNQLIKTEDNPYITNNWYYSNEMDCVISGEEPAFYVTPTASAEVKLGKQGKVSLNANASLYENKISLNYNF